MKNIALFSALLFCSAFATQAQTQTNQTTSASQSVKLVMSNAIELTFVSTRGDRGEEVNMYFKEVNDYANGVQSEKQQLKVRSNKNFSVNVKTNSGNFTYTGNSKPAPVMPVKGILGLRMVENNTDGATGTTFEVKGFATLAAEDQQLISGGKRGGDQNFTIQYNATPGFAYPAGIYSVDVVYTATQE